MTGFESFNVGLYKKVAQVAPHDSPILPRCIELYGALQVDYQGPVPRHISGPKRIVCWGGGRVQAAERVSRQCPGVEVIVFSDRDLVEKRQKVEAALKGADVFFGSLLFDFDQAAAPAL
jgi:hypothetical protein